jgi:hypothetical protein
MRKSIVAALALVNLMSAIGAAFSGKHLAMAGFVVGFGGFCVLLVSMIARDERNRK